MFIVFINPSVFLLFSTFIMHCGHWLTFDFWNWNGIQAFHVQCQSTQWNPIALNAVFVVTFNLSLSSIKSRYKVILRQSSCSWAEWGEYGKELITLNSHRHRNTHKNKTNIEKELVEVKKKNKRKSINFLDFESFMFLLNVRNSLFTWFSKWNRSGNVKSNIQRYCMKPLESYAHTQHE